ncbi:MAG: hypothetical protein SCARUB_03647 [Candidatus Scalindua rubra]|uniref:Plasmid stabilization system protein n=1 Tax=Candidatus Scalindua rubra TaxID=1872076 RepID=A0A1E3X6E9_9BACT|nr:MAG: hypothetical protein SCARUB_03647 [Candidatus Scalindua rubra]
MKPVKFHPEAQIEFLNSSLYYEEQQEYLGKRFIEHVEESVRRIQINPLLYPIAEDDCRKCRVNKFPYGIIYRIKKIHIEIIAVMNLYRKPGYWKKRLK